MATFLFTGELLQRADLVGINLDLPILPSYIGFHKYDVHTYGYFLLFVVSLPLYADAIWDDEIEDDSNVQPQEERKRINKQEDKEYENKIYSDTESDTAITMTVTSKAPPARDSPRVGGASQVRRGEPNARNEIRGSFARASRCSTVGSTFRHFRLSLVGSRYDISYIAIH
jgi:hypothetical protein